ncbi:site-specific DNA-methyltransferase [Catenulispora sp. NL8]|uniref:Methyltransferase n=1 Tax=Catenulispora pinistramenti TaxID=2705254 RepID=A0ABS5KGV1_9ACTN|nr:DNA methyltransferase [Catenulispora pinistramenti]MBS2545537.1 site-specific DNA-methyltransferase [Catenulispora pinistramenti]
MNASPLVPDKPPLSVWATAQDGPRAQRRGRYLQESEAHPAKMFPAIAAHAIACYTQPGDLVIDPMCGIGTTLVEAMHLDRMAIGVEYEQRWVDLAVRNVERAVNRGAAGYGTVVRGDAREIERLVGADAHGKAALVLTSPPYGPATHGHVRASFDADQPGIRKRNHRYGEDRNNLARQGVDGLTDGFTRILAGSRALLRPGGFLVITARPYRRTGRMIDIPTLATQAAIAAGYVLHERCVALLAAARDDGLLARASFFQLVNARNAFAAGNPTHVTAHEEVIVARPRDEDVGCGCVPSVPLAPEGRGDA